MIRKQDVNIIARNTYAWERLVQFCEDDYQYETVEGFKEYFGGGVGYDVGYDKVAGEIVLISKDLSNLIPTGIYQREIGF